MPHPEPTEHHHNRPAPPWKDPYAATRALTDPATIRAITQPMRDQLRRTTPPGTITR